MIFFFYHYNENDLLIFSLEGFHAGTAVGGIIGGRKLQYCLFGDAVTTVCL
jgi:hypothetical protein